MPYATNPDDGVRIFYEDVGSGPPLVLHHGSSANYLVWYRFLARPVDYVDRLSRHYRLLMLDARGHGQSDKPHTEAAYAMPTLVSDVVGVLDHAECDSAHFMGYSMGGRVAFGIGCYGPLERFRSLIIGGGHYINSSTFTIPEERLALLADGDMEAFIKAQEEIFGQSLTDDRREDMLALDPRAYLAYIRQTEREPSTEAGLDRMDLPVLLFAGEHDQDLPEIGRAVAEQLPRATFFGIPGREHLSTFFETDLILPKVVEFIDQVEAT